MSENHSAQGRLDSWKEIADYLKRDVRTAIRWGKNNGMPVHRVPGGKRQAVFAFKKEIDAWLVSQKPQDSVYPVSTKPGDLVAKLSPEPEAETEQEHATPALSDDKEPDSGHSTWLFRVIRRRLRTAMVIGGSLVVVGVIISFSLAPSRKSLSVPSISLNPLTEDGKEKTALRTAGTTLYFSEQEGGRRIVAAMPIAGGPIRSIETTPFAMTALQDVSNDGKTLLVSSLEQGAPEQGIWAVSTGGVPARRVGDTLCRFARWSPDSSKIACATDTRIVLMAGDGSASQIVGSFPSRVDQLIWSPDGRRLRFVLYEDAARRYTPWEMPIAKDGRAGQPHELSLSGNCCMDWAWTADGEGFAYITQGTDSKGHVRVQSGWPTREVELQVTGTPMALAPSTSSKTLFLVIDHPYRGELWKSAAGRGLQLFLPGISAAYVAYSRDRQWITYADPMNGSLWRSRVDGSDALQLTQPPVEVQVSSWSPDGRRIAYMRREPDKPWRIFLIDRDGGPTEQASEGDDYQGGPSWSRDGKAIVYGNVTCEDTQNCWIRRLDMASRKTEILGDSHGFRTARWSPDGKHIAALKPQTHELMLFDQNTQHWKPLADSIWGDTVEWSNDSQSVYVDSPNNEKRKVERIWISDGRRMTVWDLDLLQKSAGTVGTWIGLTPDNSPILLHTTNSSDIYSVNWADP
jgi:Tol biopolymer transport system component